MTQNKLIKFIKHFIAQIFYVGSDKAAEEETIQQIKNSVDFQGAKLWILILAIFVASLGLNTNSTAVIIGAMLISPIMGPIMGMGLGVGINDFELFKRSFKSFSTATIFSVLTATLYFKITPLAEAQSELLARTAPTIYDVFIALCGGLAGIIALSSISQRNGNVIPGVAIATALMPPICTTGFGIATGNWLYAAGAFYLYLINTIFISLATVIGVHIMQFKKKEFRDPQREKKVKQIIATIALLTMVPASYLTYNLVRETVYEKNANDFINNELRSDSTQIITRDISYKTQKINVVILGKEIQHNHIEEIKKKRQHYGLKNSEVSILQGGNNLNTREIQKLVSGNNKIITENAMQQANLQKKNEELEQELYPIRSLYQTGRDMKKEIKILFPEIEYLSLSQGLSINFNDTTSADTLTLVIVQLKKKMAATNQKKLEEWLHNRIKSDSLSIHIHQ